MHCNLELSEYISSLIGDSWKKDSSKLEKLLEYQNDTKVLNHFLKIKQKNKQKLCMHLKEKQDLDIDPNSIFDIQIKRLHEYKRQQLNALYAIYKYKQIKSGQFPQRPITMIFGAKAAPAYTLAKDIIHSGIYLTGGGSNMKDMDKLFTQITNIKVNTCEEPDETVVQGLSLVVTNDKFKRLAYSMRTRIFK